MVTFTNLYTPNSVKTTDSFIIELYKSYDSIERTFENKILSGQAFIPADRFKSGQLELGEFTSSQNFVQTAASHFISFTTANSIPIAIEDIFDTRILIMMPDPMTFHENTEPSIKVLDNFITGESIRRVTTDDDFEGCSSRVCYSVRHTTSYAIPGGSRLRF